MVNYIKHSSNAGAYTQSGEEITREDAVKQDDSYVSMQSSDPMVDNSPLQLSDAVKARIAKIEEEVFVGQLRVRLLRLEELMSTAPSFDNLVRIEERIDLVKFIFIFR